MFLQPDWPAPAQVKSCTTLREGGFSSPPYHSFNLDIRGDDSSHSVTQNREKLKQELHCPSEPIWLKQTHGINTVKAINENRFLEADASYTNKPNEVCVILTADCLPILICNRKGTQIAAIHAGWRGLAQGIIKKTLETIQIPSDEILVWFGPAISARHFEVGKDVYDIFLQKDSSFETAFINKDAEHWMADLYQLARLQLNTLGVTSIYGGEYCTYSNSKQFFSYRRDGIHTGRMASLIWINDSSYDK